MFFAPIDRGDVMDTLKLYRTTAKFPFGKSIFSFIVCQKVPYFKSIHPKIIELDVGKSIVEMRERRSVHNHLQTIHAIALCNLCELAMAMTVEATIPSDLRFIPVAMTVSYKKKAKGTLRANCSAKISDFQPGNLDIAVDVFDQSQTNVMSAVITLNLKPKPIR